MANARTRWPVAKAVWVELKFVMKVSDPVPIVKLEVLVRPTYPKPIEPVYPVAPAVLIGPNTKLLTIGVRPAYEMIDDPRYNKLPPAYPVCVYISTLFW